MRIKKVRLKQRAVVIEYASEKETHTLTSRDNPLPSFMKAVENLKPLVLSILHLPTEYGENLTPTGLTMADKQETELVTIMAKKKLVDSHSPFNIATPLRFLAHPEEEGSYSPALDDKDVAAVMEVLEEAKKYVAGERAQGQFPLASPDGGDEEEGEAEPQGGDVLDFGKGKQEAAAPAGAIQPPKRRRKSSAS